MNVRPLGDGIVILPDKEKEETSGGIVLPDIAKERPQEGTVIAIGSGKVLKSGSIAPISVKVGDSVIYPQHGGTHVSLDGVEHIVMDETAIYAVRFS